MSYVLTLLSMEALVTFSNPLNHSGDCGGKAFHPMEVDRGLAVKKKKNINAVSRRPSWKSQHL